MSQGGNSKAPVWKCLGVSIWETEGGEEITALQEEQSRVLSISTK